MTDKTSLQLMGEKAAKVENFGTYLSDLPVHVTDKSLLQLSAQVMGHLVRSNVQLTAALVDNEVRANYPKIIPRAILPCSDPSHLLKAVSLGPQSVHTGLQTTILCPCDDQNLPEACAMLSQHICK